MKPIQLLPRLENALLQAIWDARASQPQRDEAHPLWIALGDAERLVTDHRVIKAFITDSDQVCCAFCWEGRCENAPPTDHDADYHLHRERPWCDNHDQCYDCGTVNGLCEDTGDESLQGVWDGPGPIASTQNG